MTESKEIDPLDALIVALDNGKDLVDGFRISLALALEIRDLKGEVKRLEKALDRFQDQVNGYDQ